MAHPAKNRSASDDRASAYQTITDRIIAELEQGRVPWVPPWTTARAGLGMPRNAATGRPYSGINILTLWNAVVARGCPCHAFLTFRQALALGGNVRRGEEGKRNDRLIEALPVGLIIFPGNGIQDNLADKARKLGIPLWDFRAK